MERMASDPLPFSPVPSRACTHTQVSSSQQPEDQKRLHVEAVLTLRSQTSLRCYCDDLPRKSNTYNSRKEFYLWAFSLLPSRDQCKTKGREKMAPKKKKNPTSEEFWSGENAEGGFTLELGITYCPETREGIRTCCRWQLLPTDAQITMSRMRRCEAIEETFPASRKFSFSLTLLRPI